MCSAICSTMQRRYDTKFGREPSPKSPSTRGLSCSATLIAVLNGLFLSTTSHWMETHRIRQDKSWPRWLSGIRIVDVSGGERRDLCQIPGLPRCRCGLHSSGRLGSVCLVDVRDVSGQPIGSNFKGHEFQEERRDTEGYFIIQGVVWAMKGARRCKWADQVAGAWSCCQDVDREKMKGGREIGGTRVR